MLYIILYFKSKEALFMHKLYLMDFIEYFLSK